jgi:hypothetical protein
VIQKSREKSTGTDIENAQAAQRRYQALRIHAALLLALIVPCCGGPGADHDALDAEIFRELTERSLAEAQLLTLEVDPPPAPGWRKGASGRLLDHVSRDFMDDASLEDLVFTHASSESCIRVLHRPILGRRAFEHRPERFADRYMAWQLAEYDDDERELLSASVAPSLETLAGRRFYVSEFELGAPRRWVVVFQHLSEDMRDFYVFELSSTAKEDPGAQGAYAELQSLVRGARYWRLPPYESALYRAEERLWMTLPRAGRGLTNAIMDESIEELEAAAAAQPEDWCAHLLLAQGMAGSHYFVMPGEDDSAARVSVNVGGELAPMLPLDREAALVHYARALELDPPPRVAAEAYYRAIDLLDDAARGEEAAEWSRRAATRQAIQELAGEGDWFAQKVLARAMEQ